VSGLSETDGVVTIVAATEASLDAEDRGAVALAESLGLKPPTSWPPEHNDARTRDWMRGLLRANPDDPGCGAWYVVADGRPIGTCGYKGPPDDKGDVEIGYSVIETEQRRGYGAAAVALLVRRAFRDPRVRSVSAETLPSLIASQKVLSRNGFILTGSRMDEEEGEVIRFVLTRGDQPT
jgi:RimJ/RimL family protein N-acetyltransferase